MKEKQMSIHLRCPWCEGSETLADGKGKVTIEQKLRTETKKMGGWAVKFSSPGLDGMPDRLVLFPSGKLGFVELKAPGKKMRPLQEKRKRALEELGFLVFCVDSKEMIGGVLHEIRTL